MRVTHIISLGATCRVTYQLQRFFDFDFNFPFDWWITRPHGILRALDPAVDPYEPSQLAEQRFRNGEIKQIVTSDKGIIFYHDFPRFSDQYDTPVIAEWRQHLETPRSRFLRRRQRLYSLDRPSNHLLFVRHGRDASEQQKALMTGLKTRFTAARTSMLFINPRHLSSDPAATTIEFDESGGWGWRGSRAEWDAALGSLGIELDNPDRPRFDDLCGAEQSPTMAFRLADGPRKAFRKARRMAWRILD
jgi:hypothetical protein